MATRHILSALIVLGCAADVAAQESPFRNRTPNTFTAPAEVPSPRATLQEMSWLTGQWSGTGLGGVTEETWSGPASGAMMGMFRLVKDGKVVFYEFLTLVEQEGSLRIKLKHFNPDLTGWEEKADYITFRLLKLTPTEAFFEGITFRLEGPDRLRIFLAIRNRAEGTVREEEFVQSRTRQAQSPEQSPETRDRDFRTPATD